MAGVAPVRLNIGCGPVQPDGWWNIDHDQAWANPLTGATLADPLGTLPTGDDTAEGAVAHHVLQMVPWPNLVQWLTEVRRVLRPNAVLRLSVPDLLGAMEAHDRGDRAWFPVAPEHEPSVDGALCMYLTQAGATRSVFTSDWLAELLLRAGYRRAWRTSCGNTLGPKWLADLDSRPAESIYVEGRA